MIAELCLQEGRKLFAQKYPYFLIGGMMLLEGARMLVSALTPPETSLDVMSGPQLWAQGVGWALRLMVFLVLMFGAMGFSQEFSLGTAKTLLVLPITRRVWIAAKMVSLVALAWGMLLAAALLGWIIVALTAGWGAVVREGLVLYSPASYWGSMALAVGLTAVFLLPVCCFGLLIGLYFGHSGPAVGVAILSGMVLETLAGLLEVGKYVFIHPLHRPLLLIAKIGRGTPFSWEQTLEVGLPVALISFLVFALWALIRLERMDIQG